MGKVFEIFFMLISHSLKWQRLEKIRITLLLAGVLLFTTGSALATEITFPGVMEKGGYEDWDGRAIAHFQLKREAVVSLKFSAQCKNINHIETGMKLYYGNEVDNSEVRKIAYVSLKDLGGQAWSPLPLQPGDYTILINCELEYRDPRPPTPYKITYSYEYDTSQYPSEGTPGETNFLASSQVYGGRLGYVRGDADIEDIRCFYAERGTKVKIKLEYDARLKGSVGPIDLGVEASRYGGGWPPADIKLDLKSKWTHSGQVSKEITIPDTVRAGSGSYCFSLFSAHNRDNIPFPPTHYGAYRMSFIVNEDDPLEGLKSEILTATWRKKYNGDKIQHYLKVEYEIENSYNKTKEITGHFNLILPSTAPANRAIPRTETVNAYKSICKNRGKIYWNEFCTESSERDGKCHFNINFQSLPIHTIPAHTKKKFTANIPVTTPQYSNFDDSFQLILLVPTLRGEIEDKDACYMHGISFVSSRVDLPPILQLLLN